MGVCRVHFLRNVLAKVPKANAEMVAAAIRTIFAQPSAEAVAAQFDRIVATLEPQFPVVAAMLVDASDDLLGFTAFPIEHWRDACSLRAPSSLVGEDAGAPGVTPLAHAVAGFSISVSPRGAPGLAAVA